MPKSTRQKGRPNGLILHTEAFEAICAARNVLKRQVAADADVSPSFIADLLAKRGGTTRPVAERIASTLGVKVEALFPETAGWVSPLPDRDAKRKVGVDAEVAA